MKSLPCKNCITLPICRSIYLNEVEDGGVYDGRVILYSKCELLKNYLYGDTSHKGKKHMVYIVHRGYELYGYMTKGSSLGKTPNTPMC